MNELVRLLVELSEDPIRREEFLTDPEAVLGAASLSQEQRAALLTRDPQEILELLGQKGPSLFAFIAILPQPDAPEEEPSDEPLDPDEPPGPPVGDPPGEEPRTLEAREASV